MIKGKNNKIPKIQQIEITLTESKDPFFFVAYVKKFKASYEGRTCFG